MTFTIIVVLLALGILWLRSRHAVEGRDDPDDNSIRRKRLLSKSADKSFVPNPFHAVSIRHGSDACETVASLGNKRFLSVEAPGIPMPECDQPRCNCRYQHYRDRRNRDSSRRSISQAHYHGQERRRIMGRRGDDHNDYALN